MAPICIFNAVIQLPLADFPARERWRVDAEAARSRDRSHNDRLTTSVSNVCSHQPQRCSHSAGEEQAALWSWGTHTAKGAEVID